MKAFFKGTKPIRSVNTDEPVAYGAAVQGAVLSGAHHVGKVLVVDINPFTLWFETTKKTLKMLIPRGSRIPFVRNQTFTRAVGYQSPMPIPLYKGEGEGSDNDLFIGTLEFTNIHFNLKDEFDISFEIDASGMLNVYLTVNKFRININVCIKKDNAELSSDEKERMMKDAKTFTEIDKRMKETVDARNDLEQFVYLLRYLINDKGQLSKKLNEDDKTVIKEAVMSTISWMESNNRISLDYVIEKKRSLQKLLQSTTSKLYQRPTRSRSKDQEEL